MYTKRKPTRIRLAKKFILYAKQKDKKFKAAQEVNQIIWTFNQKDVCWK